MRVFVTGIILMVNLVLQSTVFQAIQIRGIMPNTAVVIIVSYALLRGSVEGAITGFFSGLLQDIFFGTSLGFFTCLGMLTGYFSGKASQNFYRENYLIPLLLCTSATFLYECFVYSTSFLFRGNLNFFYYFQSLILPETVYTAVISMIIYRILYGINEIIEQKERYKRKLF